MWHLSFKCWEQSCSDGGNIHATQSFNSTFGWEVKTSHHTSYLYLLKKNREQKVMNFEWIKLWLELVGEQRLLQSKWRVMITSRLWGSNSLSHPVISQVTKIMAVSLLRGCLPYSRNYTTYLQSAQLISTQIVGSTRAGFWCSPVCVSNT